MTVTGQGEVFFADTAKDIFLVGLEGDGLSVNGSALLAMDASLEYDVHRVKGAGMMSGGMFNTLIQGHGTVALAEILAEVRARTTAEYVPDDSDPLLVDLARRLERRGLRVALGLRGKLGLVASHQGMCLTIETDSVLQGASLRESLRLRPDMLRRLGWHYLRVHAFELFSDPDAVADRITKMLGLDTSPVTEPIQIVAG
jgi:hypothetical protein